jgi:hypothetical protein
VSPSRCVYQNFGKTLDLGGLPVNHVKHPKHVGASCQRSAKDAGAKLQRSQRPSPTQFVSKHRQNFVFDLGQIDTVTRWENLLQQERPPVEKATS